MDSNSQQGVGNPPLKPWEQGGTTSGSAPFKPPSPGTTSDVVEASGTARPGELVSATNTAVNRNSLSRPLPTRPWEQQTTYGNAYGATGYGSSGLNYTSQYGGGGMYGSSYGGLGSTMGSGMYGSNMYNRGGYGGQYGGSGMYSGGMYGGGGFGGPMGGYGMGPGNVPYNEQDPNNPFGAPSPPPNFWISFLRVMQGVVTFFGRIAVLIDQNTQAFHMFMSALLQLFDRSGVLYGELARFAFRLLGIRTKSKKVHGTGADGAPLPHNPRGNPNYIESPKAGGNGALDDVWGVNNRS